MGSDRKGSGWFSAELQWLTAALVASLFCTLLCTPGRADDCVAINLTEPLNSFSGKTVETFTDSLTDETPLGNAEADAARAAAGADIAVLCGADVGQSLEAGVTHLQDLQTSVSGECALCTLTVTPYRLRLLLEYGLSHIVLDKDEYIDREASAFAAFPQISGFSLRYDASAPCGERVMTIRLDDERQLDLQDDSSQITLCTTVFHITGGYGFAPEWSYSDAGVLLADALYAWLLSGATTDYASLDRIREYGANDNSIYSKIPPGMVVLCIGIVILCDAARIKKRIAHDR